jgi:hypothetical protein
MKNTILYNETELNGKFQVRANIVLEGKGILNCGGYYIQNVNGSLVKGLTNYWVSKEALEALKTKFEMTRVCF